MTESIQSKLDFLFGFYRQSETRWAGGNHFNKIILAETPWKNHDTWAAVDGRGDRVYSKNGKWSGSNSTFNLRCNQEFLDNLEQNELHEYIGFIDDNPVFVLHKENKPIARVFYVKQGKGFNIARAEGWAFTVNDPCAIRRVQIERKLIIAANEKQAYRLAGRTLPKNWIPSVHYLWAEEENIQEEMRHLTDRTELVKFLVDAWRTSRYSRETKYRNKLDFVIDNLVQMNKLSKKEVYTITKNLKASENLL